VSGASGCTTEDGKFFLVSDESGLSAGNLLRMPADITA
jgi:hypothetical protein